jgi:quercetin dioxygenase-like cupin family protein
MAAGGEAWRELDGFRTRADGKSEFVRVRIPEGETRQLLDHSGDKTLIASVAFNAPNVRLVHLPADLDQPPHPAPEPQIVVVLRGRLEVTVTGTDETKRWGPGDLVIAGDHDGIGHYTKTVDGSATVMFVPLGDLDFNRWVI